MADLIIQVTCPKCHRVIESTTTGNLYERLEKINLNDPCESCRRDAFNKSERVLHMRKMAKRKPGFFDGL